MAFELGATPSSTTGVHTNAALDQAYYNKNQSSLSSMLSRLSACDDPRAKGDAQMIGHLQEQALHMEQQLTHMQAALQNERQQAAEQQMRLNREVEMARRNQLDRHPDGSLKPLVRSLPLACVVQCRSALSRGNSMDAAPCSARRLVLSTATPLSVTAPWPAR